jgi:TonB-dependent starch-binding outer membrane protein SusC
MEHNYSLKFPTKPVPEPAGSRITGVPDNRNRKYKNVLLLLIMVCGAFAVQAQTTLEGILKDTITGDPIIGATITVKGTNEGTATDVEGIFTISTNQFYPVTLIVNAVGYESQEFTLKEASSIPLTINLRNSNLGEELVVVGYGVQKKKDLVGAIAQVDPNEVNKLPVGGIDAMLQGKAAGVQVNSNSGIPGDAVYLRVRGTTSINATNEPLYIVDGVFINNTSLSTLDLGGKVTSPLSDINPSDIASIEVLKDASAIAIYGSRGANGVVIITTKRGDFNKKPTINFNYSQGRAWAQKSRLWDLTSGQEHAELVNEAWINSGKDNPKLNQTYENRPFRPVDEVINGVPGRGTPEEQQTYDRLDDLFRTATIHNADLSLDGGNKNTKYYIGGSYTDQEAIIRPSTFKRGSFKINLDQKVNNFLQVGISNSVSYSYRNQTRAGTGTGTGIFQSALHTPTYQPKNNPDGTPSRQSPFENLQVLLDNVDIHTRSLRYIGNFYADANILKNLKFRSSWSVDYNNYDEFESNNNKTIAGTATNGLTNTALSQVNALINEQTLTYRKSFNGRHNITGLLGNTLQSNSSNVQTVQATGFPNSSYTQVANATSTVASSTSGKSNLVSFFGRADYNFKEKYYLEASLRSDASSKFGKNHKWGYFPSAGIGWRIKQENFLKDVDFISELKLRASYGIIGNQNGISNYASLGYWSGGAAYSYPDQGGTADKPGTGPVQPANPDLKWEKTKQSNAGLDVQLFQSRIGIAFDVYYKYTTDLLVLLSPPATSGYPSYSANAGEMSNKGYEFSLNTLNIVRKNFSWSTNFNISGNKNKIEKYQTPTVAGSRDMIRLQEGYSMGTFWLYKQLYVDKETGNAVFEDVNGDGKITTDDRQMMGSALPKFFGGFTNKVTYRNFDLNIFFSYSYGNQVVSFDRILGEGGGTKDNNRMILAYNLKRWQNPGDETDVPRVTSVGNNYGIEQNSRFLEDASFIRLKTLTLGYTLPAKLVSRAKVEALRVYVTGGNLWLYTKYIGPDPESVHNSEQNARGIDVGTPPQPQSFQVGLNITL